MDDDLTDNPLPLLIHGIGCGLPLRFEPRDDPVTETTSIVWVCPMHGPIPIAEAMIQPRWE